MPDFCIEKQLLTVKAFEILINFDSNRPLLFHFPGYGENKDCLLRQNTVIQRCIEYRQGIFDYEMSVNRDNEAATMETVCK